MKKIICLILVLGMAFAFFACDDTCEEHKDEDKNGKCDVCETVVGECEHKDEDKNAKCDSCGADVECAACVDADANGKCDVCGDEVPCEACVDEDANGKCDVCGKAVGCEECVDEDKNAICDVCGSDVECDPCVDADKNAKCDVCGKAVVCKECVDEDVNGVCDVCNKAIKCEKHTDANADGVCDVCGGASGIVCTNHVDSNKNGVCEICGEEVTVDKNATFFDIIAESKPTVITTLTSLVYPNGDTYKGNFVTEINGDDFTFEYWYETLSQLDILNPAPDFKTIEEGVVYYKDGRYSEDGENWFDMAPDVQYMSMTFNITAENVGECTFKHNGKTLNAELDKEQVKAIFGIDIDADSFELEVKNNGTFLGSVKLEYVNKNGAAVKIETSYTYNPVAE